MVNSSLSLNPCQVKENSVQGEASSSVGSAAADPEETLVDDDDDDDDELDMDELNELEASLSRTSIQIREPGADAWEGARGQGNFSFEHPLSDSIGFTGLKKFWPE